MGGSVSGSEERESFVSKLKILGVGVIAVVTVAGVFAYQRSRTLERGAELAASYCATCHLEPAPELLPKRSWEAALGYMGYWLGIENIDYLDDAIAAQRGPILLPQ